MSAEEIRKLEAGRVLDSIVAMQVMGWKQSPAGNYPWQLAPPEAESMAPVKLCPNYSTDIAAAWEVVEKVLEDDSLGLSIYDTQLSFHRRDWIVHFIREKGMWAGSEAETLPLAICRAALLAVMGDES